eukprot:m.242248 g.242248  ORF g.242248 m.242248 type:complete len:315 (+) comp25425_c0_seq1:99-1043(+)
MAQFARRVLPRLWPRRQAVRFHSEVRRFKSVEPESFTKTPLFYMTVGTVGVAGLYVATHLERTPISERLRFMSMSNEAEEALGEESFQQVMAQYQDNLYPAYHPVTRRVERIASQIIEKTPLRSQQWTFHVVRSPELNCFVLPGRHVFVFEGILPILDTDDAMAAVLGHEIAHLYARHAAERMSLRYVVVGLAVLISLSGIDISPFFRNLMLQVGLELPFSRKMESEADYIGLHLMSECCFNPAAAAGVFEKMEEAQKGRKVPQYLSTHPANPQRVKQLKEWLPEMKAVRWKNDCGEAEAFEKHLAGAYNVRYR